MVQPRSCSGRCALAALGVLLAVAQPGAQAGAQDIDDPTARDFVSLGVGVGPDYPGADERQVVPTFSGRYSTDSASLMVMGPSLGIDVLGPRTGGRVIGGGLVRYRSGRSDVEDDAVDALPDVDGSVEIGGFVGYRFVGLRSSLDSVTLRVDALADVSGGHDGFVLAPSAAYGFPIAGRVMANVAVRAEYGSESFQDAYFGVTPGGAAASGLAPFDPEAGFHSVGLSAGLTYPLTPSLGITGQVGYTRLTGDAADSPVVDDAGSADQVFVGLGVMYRF